MTVRDGARLAAARWKVGFAKDSGGFERTVLMIGLGAAFALGAANALRGLPGPDVSYLLHAADRVLQGARYGSDVLEINPPLIVWLYTIPVSIGRLAMIAPHRVLTGVTLVVAAAALAFLWRALAMYRHRAAYLVALGGGALLLPASEFGQREHVAALLFVFWCGTVVRRLDADPDVALPSRLAPAVGAIGILLKPHFLFAWLAVESVVVYRRGWRALIRRENAILVTLGVVYVVATAILTPDFMNLARALGPAYSNYLSQLHLEAAAAAAGIGVFAVYRARWPVAAGARAVAEAASAGFLLAAVAQLKWWPYHFLPAMIYAAPALAAAAAGGRTRSGKALVCAAVLAVVAALAVFRNLDRAARPHAPRNLAEPHIFAMRDAIRVHSPDEPVAVLSTNILSAWPLLYLSGSEPALRLPSLWPLLASYHDAIPRSGLIDTRPVDQRSALERWLSDVVHEDLSASPPGIIFAFRPEPSTNAPGMARRIDYLGYFTADPRIGNLLQAYRRAEPVGPYDVLVRYR